MSWVESCNKRSRNQVIGFFFRFLGNLLPVIVVFSLSVFPFTDTLARFIWLIQDKYEPAPGKVTTHYFFYNGTCWCHGNFVARQKRSGWLSFLQPAPRTLFFFEISGSGYPREKVVTCTPLGMHSLLRSSLIHVLSCLFLQHTYGICSNSLEDRSHLLVPNVGKQGRPYDRH